MKLFELPAEPVSFFLLGMRNIIHDYQVLRSVSLKYRVKVDVIKFPLSMNPFYIALSVIADRQTESVHPYTFIIESSAGHK
ncbi:MAG: hypothetical protein WD896_01670 [Parcubacteria group bacterium]